MRLFWPSFCILTLVSANVSAAASVTCDASNFVTSAGGAFASAARVGKAGTFAGAASRFADLHGIAMFALGPHRKLMPKSREAEYVSLTRIFIGKFMAENSSQLAFSGLSITDCSGGKGSMVVNTKLPNGKKVVFKVYKTRSGYRVRDVNVSNIWLAQQLRSNFTGVIRNNNLDIDALFAYLRR